MAGLMGLALSTPKSKDRLHRRCVSDPPTKATIAEFKRYLAPIYEENIDEFKGLSDEEVGDALVSILKDEHPNRYFRIFDRIHDHPWWKGFIVSEIKKDSGVLEESSSSSKKSRNRLFEAIFMDSGNDPRSYNDIYGENGSVDDDIGENSVPFDENGGQPPAAPENLGPAEIQQLRDLAHQILAIVGEGTSEDMTGTPDFMSDDNNNGAPLE